MKSKILQLIATAAVAVGLGLPAHAFEYGSGALMLGDRAYTVTYSIVEPWDIFVTESWVRGRFYKRLPPGAYTILSTWNVVSTWWPGLYLHGWYKRSSAFGEHCVSGKHRFFYLEFFGYTYDSGPACIEKTT